MTKAAVIGLDGAGWHVLDPMIEAGVMPHLGEIKAAGASGPLRSTLPVFTPPAWTSALTGVNPARHGIYGHPYASRWAVGARGVDGRALTEGLLRGMDTLPSRTPGGCGRSPRQLRVKTE